MFGCEDEEFFYHLASTDKNFFFAKNPVVNFKREFPKKVENCVDSDYTKLYKKYYARFF